jgi:hypothetical protein
MQRTYRWDLSIARAAPHVNGYLFAFRTPTAAAQRGPAGVSRFGLPIDVTQQNSHRLDSNDCFTGGRDIHPGGDYREPAVVTGYV